MSTAFAVCSNEDEALLKPNKSSSKQWTTTHLLLICFLVLVFSVLLSNIDRIIESLSDSNATNDKSQNLDIDILIVGGGATGIIEMNFLRETYPNKKILLIEKQNYIGGRTLSSIVTYNDKQITMEFGARRTSYDPLMWQILYYLNLCDELVFFFQNSSIAINQKPIRYFRNNIIYNWTANDVFHFTETDKTLIINDTHPLKRIYNDILNENNNGQQPETLQDWTDKFYHSNWTLNGIPIIAYSFKTALTNYLNVSSEYIEAKWHELQPWDPAETSLVHTLIRSNYGSISYANTTNDDDLYDNSLRTLKYGFLSMINGFYENIMFVDNDYDNEFDPIWLNTELIQIDYNENNNNDGYKYLVGINSVNDKYKDITQINADNIILSVDITNLKRLVADLSPIRRDLEEIDIQSITVLKKLYKINLIYNIENEELSSYLASKSQSKTDLEINEFTAFESISTNGTLALIQLYPKLDSESIFWNELQAVGQEYEINSNLSVNNMESMIIASNTLVSQVMMQMDELLSLSMNNYSLGMPLAVFVKPFGVNPQDVDGLNPWKYNVDIPVISERIRHPNKNETIFITNNEYNAVISGGNQLIAFQAGLRLIQQYFNVSYPFQDSQKCPPP